MDRCKPGCDLSRREFLWNSLAAGCATSLGFPPPAGADARVGFATRVVVVRNPSVFDSDLNTRLSVVEEMLAQGILELSGESTQEKAWARYFLSSDRIAIKSNVSATPTRPEIHAAVVKSLIQNGNQTDSIRMWDRNRGGIGLEQVDSRDWDWTPGFEKDCLSQAIHWADALVNTPALKTHSLTGISGAVKNWVGSVTGINRRDRGASFAIHANQGADMACFNAMPIIREKCRLIVVDAIQPLYQEKSDSAVYCSQPFAGLILGTDPVAVDRIGWSILRQCLQDAMGDLNYLSEPPIHLREAATRYSLGVWGREQIDLREIVLNTRREIS
jgi:hypothetical protein